MSRRFLTLMIAVSLLGILVLLPSPAAAEDGAGPNSLPSVGNRKSVVRIEYPVEFLDCRTGRQTPAGSRSKELVHSQ